MGLMHGIKLDALASGIRANGILPFAFTRMVVDLFPADLAPCVAPEHVSADVSFLASEECRPNGEVFLAGGAHFCIARTIETAGVDVADTPDISAETIATNIETDTDLSSFHL